MSQAAALLAEPDCALRGLMKRVLLSSAYAVLESADARQLQQHLQGPALFSAATTLLVLHAQLASPLAPLIMTAVRTRARLGLRATPIVLTYEFGALPLQANGDLEGCPSAYVLEKPFDFCELQVISMRYRFVATTGRTDDVTA